MPVPNIRIPWVQEDADALPVCVSISPPPTYLVTPRYHYSSHSRPLFRAPGREALASKPSQRTFLADLDLLDLDMRNKHRGLKFPGFLFFSLLVFCVSFPDFPAFFLLFFLSFCNSQDVNFPKFLEMDLPLFEGIISDLFPGRKRPVLDYGALNSVMKLVIQDKGLQSHPFFTTKA